MSTIGMRSLLMMGLAALLAFGLGCGGKDDAATAAHEAAEKAAEATREAAAAAGAAAEQAMEEAGAAAGEAMDEVEAAAGEAKAAVEDAMNDPAARCLDLASKQAWAESLEACTAAHEAKPDDMAIEHALQHAKAATE